jgi:hypothetical protein
MTCCLPVGLQLGLGRARASCRRLPLLLRRKRAACCGDAPRSCWPICFQPAHWRLVVLPQATTTRRRATRATTATVSVGALAWAACCCACQH